MEGFTKLMLLTLVASRDPLGPAHELFAHGNKLIEITKNKFLVMFIGTWIGCFSLAKLLRLLVKLIEALVSL